MSLSSLTSRSNSKQALKTDDNHNCSFKSSSSSQPQEDQSIRTTASLLSSPQLFRNLLTNTKENVVSPTSMLDAKHIFGLKTPSIIDKKEISFSAPCNASKHLCGNSVPSPIGLAIITSDDKDLVEDTTKVTTRASLKIQIPPVSPTTPPSIGKFPRSPSDFGIKTHSLLSLSPSSSFRKRDAHGSVLTGQLYITEMELSEDYTCVISHGPNHKTTLIFDNFVVGSYNGGSQGRGDG